MFSPLIGIAVCLVGFVAYRLFKSPKIITISIDGLIGSGKSTLIEKLKKKTDFVLIPEPLDKWFQYKDVDGKNILEKFYNDKSRWGYTFQNVAFLTRVKALTDAIEKINQSFGVNDIIKRILGIPYILITERSILTDKYVFAQMLFDEGIINQLEFSLYNDWFVNHSPKIKFNNIIYVRTTVKNAVERIKSRGRMEEVNIPEKYLSDLETYHNKWLFKNNKEFNVLCLELNDVKSDLSSKESLDKYESHIINISRFINDLE